MLFFVLSNVCSRAYFCGFYWTKVVFVVGCKNICDVGSGGGGGGGWKLFIFVSFGCSFWKEGGGGGGGGRIKFDFC